MSHPPLTSPVVMTVLSRIPVRRGRIWFGVIAGLMLLALPVHAGDYATDNFIVEAGSVALAADLAEAAESWRHRIAHEWLGQDLPPWETRCRILIREEPNGGSGFTSYDVHQGRATNFEIKLHGDRERIFENVLAHEISHAVLASQIGRIIPRWADEGMAMMSESEAVRLRQHLRVRDLFQSNASTTLGELFHTSEYPQQHDQLLLFYARSYSLTEFLVTRSSRPRFLEFLRHGARLHEDATVSDFFGFANAEELEVAWRKWSLHAPAAMSRLAVNPPLETDTPMGR